MSVVGEGLDRGCKSSGNAGIKKRCKPDKGGHDDDNGFEHGKVQLKEIAASVFVNEQQNDEQDVGNQQDIDEGHTGKVKKWHKDVVQEMIEGHSRSSENRNFHPSKSSQGGAWISEAGCPRNMGVGILEKIILNQI